MAICFDLTNSLYSWKGKVVGIIRVELKLAEELLVLIPELEFVAFNGSFFEKVNFDKKSFFAGESFEHLFQKVANNFIASQDISRGSVNSINAGEDCLKNSFRNQEIKEALKLIINAFPRPVDGILNRLGSFALKSRRKLLQFSLKQSFNKEIKKVGLKEGLPSFIFKEDDVFFSCGWFNSGKEEFLSSVKEKIKNFKIVYVVYDNVILNPSTNPFYTSIAQDFKKYLSWISFNCDYIIYGGKTAQNDIEKYFSSLNKRIPPGFPIKFGSDIAKNSQQKKGSPIKQLEDEQFILAVGTIEGRKNYRLLYEAYCLAAIENINLPKLVIAGSAYEKQELIDDIKLNPFTKDKIVLLSPSDNELLWLYSNSLFVVLPTFYEGWSLTLPEALSYGKFCICSDVPPLREIGEGFVEFVDPNSPKSWLKAIHYYESSTNRKQFEANIAASWNSISWKDCARKIAKHLQNISRAKVKEENVKLYFDLSFFFYQGSITGIPRTEFILAREIYKKIPSVNFFALINGKFIELSHSQLYNLLFSDTPIKTAVEEDRKAYFNNRALSGCTFKTQKRKNLEKGFKRLFEVFHLTKILRKNKAIMFQPLKADLPFEPESIVFSAGVGFEPWFYDSIDSLRKTKKVKLVQLIYDYTPITVPHTHVKETLDHYLPFLKDTYTHSDFLLFGGTTASEDGIRHQKSLGLEPLEYGVLRFGSDLYSNAKTVIDDRASYSNLPKGPFILCVGTIQSRKNQIILYEAYLKLLKDKSFVDNLPILVLCGYPGWRNETLLSLLKNDSRVRDKIVLLNPSDEELDVLYKKCLFTVLPSLYEGWSLTLPESLGYGKLCIASYTKSLIEIGQEWIDYANPYDPDEWAEKIKFYTNNREALASKENGIRLYWQNVKWSDTTECLFNFIERICESSSK